MPELVIKTDKIIKNIEKINNLLEKNDIHWTLITKMVCGDEAILEKLLHHEEIKRTHSIGDSRLSSLKKIKNIHPDIVTMYIKPPPINYAKSIVRYADISLNTSFRTIEALNTEAGKQKKKHRVIIMIELGELREGIIRDNVVKFYKKAFELENIVIEGIGTNLGCMYGVEPTFDKLVQLSLYEQLLENIFNKKMNLISGGSSITLPLIKKGKIPKAVNHFRVGEAAFKGTSPFDNKKFSTLSTDAFNYRSYIVELEQKQMVPEGIISEGNVGHSAEYDDFDSTDRNYRAVLDFGILDVDVEEISPKDKNINYLGTTSDLTVYDLGNNKNNKNQNKYKVGDKIDFHSSYIGTARLMNSQFVEKKIT